MTDNSSNFNYSLVQNEEGNFVVRSTVNSFNLDHVTDKDVVSFYNRFSQYASFDTGLLPLDGTGVLAIRSAGKHAQVVTQHAAGIYHINWGAREGDPHATTYYVAQPYRIVIGDFLDGNLLGARMFYSPYPITNPSQQLYHVNLPNINCKGYRGNGVGWICLYLKEDWSELPFNEKVTRFIERCSGVETYNDANMSETDGPRFYSENNKPSYFWNPGHWQDKSSSDGFSWTLDPDLLIPILVEGLDSQDKHYPSGQPLTLAMAMLGNYQAYYYDKDIPKTYNLVSRSDLFLTSNNIADMFKVSFAQAPAVFSSKEDPYSASLKIRQNSGSFFFVPPPDPINEDEEDDDTWCCTCCEQILSISEDQMNSTHEDGYICQDCLEDRYVFISSTQSYFYIDSPSVSYVDNQNEFFHEDYDLIWSCDSCCDTNAVSGNSLQNKNNFYKEFVYETEDNGKLCKACFEQMIAEEDLPHQNCYVCSKLLVSHSDWNNLYPNYQIVFPQFDQNNEQEFSIKSIYLCNYCKNEHKICPCGLLKSSNEQFCSITNQVKTETDNPNTLLVVESACSTCVHFDVTQDTVSSTYSPIDPQAHQLAIENCSANNLIINGISFNYQDYDEAF